MQPKDEEDTNNVRIKNLDILSMDTFNRIYDTSNNFSPLFPKSPSMVKIVPKIFSFSSNFINDINPSFNNTRRKTKNIKTFSFRPKSINIIKTEKKKDDFLVKNLKLY